MRRFRCRTCRKVKYEDAFPTYWSHPQQRRYMRSDCVPCTTLIRDRRRAPHLTHHGYVPVRLIAEHVDALCLEVGATRASEILGFQYQTIWLWRYKKVSKVQRQKAADVFDRLLAYRQGRIPLPTRQPNVEAQIKASIARTLKARNAR